MTPDEVREIVREELERGLQIHLSAHATAIQACATAGQATNRRVTDVRTDVRELTRQTAVIADRLEQVVHPERSAAVSGEPPLPKTREAADELGAGILGGLLLLPRRLCRAIGRAWAWAMANKLAAGGMALGAAAIIREFWPQLAPLADAVEVFVHAGGAP